MNVPPIEGFCKRSHEMLSEHGMGGAHKFQVDTCIEATVRIGMEFPLQLGDCNAVFLGQ